MPHTLATIDRAAHGAKLERAKAALIQNHWRLRLTAAELGTSPATLLRLIRSDEPLERQYMAKRKIGAPKNA